MVVFAACQHQVDIRVLPLFSKSASECVRQSLSLRPALSQSFIFNFKPTILHKCHKAMCNELKLVLPMHMTEELANSGNQFGSIIADPKPDTDCQPELCSGFTRYSITGCFSSDVLLGRFVLTSIEKSDDLGKICDLTLTNNSLSLFLLKPKVDIQLNYQGSVVETHTRFLCSRNYDGCQTSSKVCGCSAMNKTVANILAESCRSVGIELDLQVDKKQCFTLRENPLAQQRRHLVEFENQQPFLQEHEDEEKFMSDVKVRIQAPIM